MGRLPALFGGLFWALMGPVAAQDMGTSMRKAYDSCFYNSVSAQVSRIPPQGRLLADASMIAETAFQACLTEENAFGVYLTSIAEPRKAQVMMLAVKLQLKRDLQDIFANPEKHRKQLR